MFFKDISEKSYRSQENIIQFTYIGKSILLKVKWNNIKNLIFWFLFIFMLKMLFINNHFLIKIFNFTKNWKSNELCFVNFGVDKENKYNHTLQIY